MYIQIYKYGREADDVLAEALRVPRDYRRLDRRPGGAQGSGARPLSTEAYSEGRGERTHA